jgi:hypothetical protein
MYLHPLSFQEFIWEIYQISIQPPLNSVSLQFSYSYYFIFFIHLFDYSKLNSLTLQVYSLKVKLYWIIHKTINLFCWELKTKYFQILICNITMAVKNYKNYNKNNKYFKYLSNKLRILLIRINKIMLKMIVHILIQKNFNKIVI